MLDNSFAKVHSWLRFCESKGDFQCSQNLIRHRFTPYSITGPWVAHEGSRWFHSIFQRSIDTAFPERKQHIHETSRKNGKHQTNPKCSTPLPDSHNSSRGTTASSTEGAPEEAEFGDEGHRDAGGIRAARWHNRGTGREGAGIYTRGLVAAGSNGWQGDRRWWGEKGGGGCWGVDWGWGAVAGGWRGVAYDLANGCPYTSYYIWRPD